MAEAVVAATDTSVLSLKALGPDARELSADDFLERHGNAFFLLSATELNEPDGPASTQLQALLDAEPPAEQTATLSLLVYPVRRSERSVSHLLTLGRTANSDVVIRDRSVSRFHAFIKADEDGRLHIQDAESTNGTRVNGKSAPIQGQGPPIPLLPGDDVRLGHVELTFLDGLALRDFVLAHQR
jgi:pSer/pThr/pTyr-binding forkhead associated (FHA) protein